MALTKSLPVPGGFTAEYIQFDRIEAFDKSQKYASITFAVWKDKAAADAAKAAPQDPSSVPAIKNGVGLRVEGAKFDQYFPNGAFTLAGVYAAAKAEPVRMWHRSDNPNTTTTNPTAMLLNGAVDA
jgi:hypothetical protein